MSARFCKCKVLAFMNWCMTWDLHPSRASLLKGRFEFGDPLTLRIKYSGGKSFLQSVGVSAVVQLMFNPHFLYDTLVRKYLPLLSGQIVHALS